MKVTAKCSIALMFLALSSVSIAETMQFEIAPRTRENELMRNVVRGGEFEVFASGEIDSGATDRFLKFLDKEEIENALVIFDSPGGSLFEGLRLGKAIRERNFNTAIGRSDPYGNRTFDGMCASSCAYAFAGGVYRFYSGGRERLGIHQFYVGGNNQGDIGEAQEASSRIIAYLQSMDVDPSAFIVASTARGDSMHWLTPEQSTALRLSNNGAKPTTVEIKMTGTDPYLKVEQTTSVVTGRLLFGCSRGAVTLSAGIVTTPELSKIHRASLTRSYLETTKGESIAVVSGDSQTVAIDSVLWLIRLPNPIEIASIVETDEIGIWTENNGPNRWGAIVNLKSAREQIRLFGKNCRQPTE